MRLLKSCSYDCSALKNYTILQFSGDDICCLTIREYCGTFRIPDNPLQKYPMEMS